MSVCLFPLCVCFCFQEHACTEVKICVLGMYMFKHVQIGVCHCPKAGVLSKKKGNKAKIHVDRTVFLSKADPSVRSPHVFAISRASRVACKVNNRSTLPLGPTHIHTYQLPLCNMIQNCVALVSLYALTYLIPFALSGCVSPHTCILCLSLCLSHSTHTGNECK